MRYFHGALPFSSHALSLSSHALQLSFICKHRVAKFKFRYISIYFHIYICYVWKKSFPFIKDCMTYIPFLSQTRAPHFWRSHISLGISSPHLQMPRYKHRWCYPQLDSGADFVGTFGSMGGQEQLKRPPRSFRPHNFHKGRGMVIKSPQDRSNLPDKPLHTIGLVMSNS